MNIGKSKAVASRFGGSDGRSVGVQSCSTIGSWIMAPGNAVGNREFKRCGKKERSSLEKGFLEASQSGNQDAELDVAKCPGGG